MGLLVPSPGDSAGFEATGSQPATPEIREHSLQKEPHSQGGPQSNTAVGDMARRIAEFDWARTPLGPMSSWPPTLRTMVDVMLANRFPLLLWWGPQYISIYNDAYAPILGEKHPWALGTPVSECWSEIWDVLRPLIDTPFHGGEATWIEDFELYLNRSGFIEETHFTVAYSAVPDVTAMGGIGGVLATVHEITNRVVAERRVDLLRKLARRSSDAESDEEACRTSIDVLKEHEKDLSFVLLYMIDDSREHARLISSFGMSPGRSLPELIHLKDEAAVWPLARCLANGTSERVRDTDDTWSVSRAQLSALQPLSAFVVPIHSQRAHQPVGFLVAGIAPNLLFDDRYQGFIALVASQIATTIANARAYQEERKRADALTEIDRAKTQFFSNVSHEFRTPLTLMLAPLEELLAGAPNSPESTLLAVIHRNGLRLLKLVNTLLDFSRIEAGRVEGAFEPVDLARYTTELASVFRSSIEKAGLTLRVDCAALDEPVYVDRDMWEKIVLNLLSNALKFTFNGSIGVSLLTQGEEVRMTVSDTGIGIPADKLGRLFERFYRVEGARGRTFEGTGIGLSLVRELVQLHGGTVAVASEAGMGSAFTVSIPRGFRHLPADRIRGPATGAYAASTQLYLDEALRWLGEDVETAEALDTATRRVLQQDRPKVLIADDNADMRDYLSRLLGQTYSVSVASDGELALDQIAKHRPDLVLADVMMPALDGFDLLARLRAKPDTHSLPVILLSARAGEEARIEGLAAGADDYLVKPFNARELLARVDSTLKLHAQRRASEERIASTLESIADALITLDQDWQYVYLNSAAERTLGMTRDAVLGKTVWELYPFVVGTEMETLMRKAAAEGTPQEIEYFNERRGVWFYNRIYPAPNGGISIYFTDITDKKRAAEEVRRHAAQFETLLMKAPLGVYLVDAQFKVRAVNPTALAVFRNPGKPVDGDLHAAMHAVFPAAIATEAIERFKHTLSTGESYSIAEQPVRRVDNGLLAHYEWRIDRIPLSDGQFGVVCYFRDVSAFVNARAELIEQRETLRRLDKQKDQFLATLGHELRNPLAPIKTASEVLARIGSTDIRSERAVGIVQRQVMQLTRLVDDLLDVSRVSQGRITLRMEPLLIGHAVANALETVEPLIREKNHSINVNDASGELRVMGDPTRIIQCIANVLTNAAKYTDNGGQISIHTRRVDNFASIEVTDNGIGISAEMLPHVFDLFVQSEHTLNRALGGLGIGLSLVKELIALHQGTVEVHSDGIGRGATFEMRIPLMGVVGRE